MTIDRCYCYDVLFATLRDVSCTTEAQTVAELQEEVCFGQNCGLCHPYVRRMLRTGQVTFHEVIEEADEPAPTAHTS
ncbi:MAG: (2Fe-2S)-binding protein [Longimonas sp.]|uniref:(2Fe-2S)-binding protein n=1 Tax=Longimonas sp. TaxID=2039626 RepID=UPI0039769953